MKVREACQVQPNARSPGPRHSHHPLQGPAEIKLFPELHSHSVLPDYGAGSNRAFVSFLRLE